MTDEQRKSPVVDAPASGPAAINEAVDRARAVLIRVVDAIPHGVAGVDRQMVIRDIVGGLTQGELKALQQAVEAFLLRMAENRASDIDIGGHGCRGQVWYRVFGKKEPDPVWGTFALDETSALFLSIISEKQQAFLFKHRNLDFSYSIEQGGTLYRYRADMYFDLDHLALNMRHVPEEIRPFRDLNLHANVVKTITLAYDKQGLTLVTGITGSGKTATLDSIIDANNQTSEAHITIIGSPIETIHEPKLSIVRHREVGRDVASFKEGAIQSLRQDPDVIVIGEMRDVETILTALELADSGHKVFSTLHTASAVESIDRIVAECPSEEQNRVRERLGDVLKCIISQKLVPTVSGKLVLAKEIMLMTPSARAATKNGNTSEIYQMMQEGGGVGMSTMEQDLKNLVDSGQIETGKAVDYANNKKRMEELLQMESLAKVY